jgi:hypothetical protein
MAVFKEEGLRAKGALMAGNPAIQVGGSGTLVYLHAGRLRSWNSSKTKPTGVRLSSLGRSELAKLTFGALRTRWDAYCGDELMTVVL